MRYLKALTLGMGVLIVLATTVLVVLIVRRLGGPAVAPAPFAVELNEPAGTRLVGIASAGDRLAVQLQGGGPDRLIVIDPHTGAVGGRIGLRGEGR